MSEFEISDLTICLEELQEVREDFHQELKKAFSDLSVHFKISASYFSKPTGEEQGEYWAVDFGGTKIRCQKISLENRTWNVLESEEILFLQKDGYHERAPLKAIAKMIVDHSYIGEKSFLGHAFSFVTDQSDSEEMTLIEWSKEIDIPDLIGKPINHHLQFELAVQGRPEIKPIAILNDSVSTLLAGSYVKENTLVGGICGTGFNLCIYYAYPGQKPMIYNLEAGFFGKVCLTKLDEKLDQNSQNKGKKLSEKQIGGRYLGELARIYLAEKISDFHELSPYSIHARDMSEWLDSDRIEKWLEGRKLTIDKKQKEEMARIGKALLVRSATLVGAMLSGLLDLLEEKGEKEIKGIMDGSLFTRVPIYQSTMNGVIEKFGKKIELFSLKDASSIGAAVAAGINREKIAKF